MIEIPRTYTPEIKRKAAVSIAIEMEKWGHLQDVETAADHICDVASAIDDGYTLAKKLEQAHDWKIDTSLIDYLDNWYHELSGALSAHQIQWATLNGIKPQYTVGTHVKWETRGAIETGIITAISTHPTCPLRYLIAVDGDPEAGGQSQRRRAVYFDQVHALESEAA